MKTSKNRREFIRLLSLAGFGMCLPSCLLVDSNSNEKDSKNTTKIEIQPEVDSISTIEEAMESNDVVFFKPNDEKYKNLSIGYNLTIKKKPKLIALCMNTQGIAQALKFASENNLKVAVKSGGHSFEGFSSINSGLQINLSLMNKMEWVSDNQIMIQPAALLQEVYDTTLPKQRLIPAGSCGTVGIGGLTLGGGYGFFSRKYGLTCDQLVNVEFVDGKGNIHKVNKDDELMWALKGGGNGNFGIVSGFTFSTVPAPKTFTSHRFKAYQLDKTRTKELLQAYFKFSEELPESCFAAFVLNYKTMVLLITNYGNTNSKLHDMIEAFKSLADKTSIGKKKELAPALRNYYGIDHPIPFKNASAGYYNNYESIAPFIDDVLERVFRKRGLIYQINTLGGKINHPDLARQSCYPHRDMPYLSELQTYWEEGEDPSGLLSSFEEIQEIIYTSGIRKQYRNYPNLSFKNWETAYYGEHYQQLQKIKRQYDPDNLFSHEQTIKL